MARREARPPAQREVRLTPLHEQCVSCGKRLWVAYHAQRTLMTLGGLVRLRLVVRRCRNPECALYHVPYRAEEEGAWALPHGEFGLDIITLIGQLRYGEHRSVPEIHQRLVQRGVSIAERTVTDYASARAADTTAYGRFFGAMLARGIYLAPSQFEAIFVSLAHDDAAIETTLRAAAAAFSAL